MVTKELKPKRTPTRSAVGRETQVHPDVAARAQRFLKDFPNDLACLDYLMRLRFGDEIDCPKCGRAAKFHKIRQIPAYACQWCGYHLHPMAQTGFARSRVGLRHWFHAIFLFSNGTNGLSARELQRALDLTYKTAWRMRATIVDAKFDVRERSNQAIPVDFETLFAALATPKDTSKPNRPHRPKAA